MPLSRLLALSLGFCAAACAAPDPSQRDAATATTADTEAWSAEGAYATFREQMDSYYPYLDRRGFDGPAYLDRARAGLVQASSAEDFGQRLDRVLLAFADPHLDVVPRADGGATVFPTEADLRVIMEGGEAVIRDVRRGSAAAEAGLRPGMRISHVDGDPVAARVSEAFDPALGGPPQNWQADHAATLLVNGPLGADGRVLRVDGRDTALPSPRGFSDAVEAMPLVDTERLDADTVLIRPNNRLYDNDTIGAFDNALRDSLADGATQVIVDMRNSPSGGNTEVARSIIGHFTDAPAPYMMIEIPVLEREYGVRRRFVEHVFPREPYVPPERAVVLAGTWTGSVGETVVVGLDAVGVHSIGTGMGDLLGGYSIGPLDDYGNGVRATITNDAVFAPDGLPREDFVPATELPAADMDANGRDPAVRAALAHFARAG